MLNFSHNVQRLWRTAGGFCLAGCAFLVWYAPTFMQRASSLWWVLLYWSLFLFLMGAALFVALLDIRYIRLQYRLAERELLHETLRAIQKDKEAKAAEVTKTAEETKATEAVSRADDEAPEQET